MKLKPCPFCGREGSLVAVRADGYDVCSIRCNRCDVETQPCDDADDACGDWNSRPIEDRLRRELEDLGARAIESIKEAYECGYDGGHNDTVEGVFCDNGQEAASEFYFEAACDEYSAVSRFAAILAKYRKEGDNG